MSELLIYKGEDWRTKLNVLHEYETLWFSSKQLTDLFDKAKGTISEHIKQISEDCIQYEVAFRIAITMQDWGNKLVTLNDGEILQYAGRVTAQLVKAHTEKEFEIYCLQHDLSHESYFHKIAKSLLAKRLK
jgi:hypothetical protein